MSLQIIAGKYKGRRLDSPVEKNVRPPLTRFRRAVFDTLMPYLHRGPFLDLFGGSGSFTVEALSRGAPEATIIELHEHTAKLIERNLKKTQVEEPVEVLRGDSLGWIPKLAQQGRQYGVISAAPPYHQDLEDRILTLLDTHNLLQPDGLLFLQYPTQQTVLLEHKYLQHWRAKKYGKTTFSYFFLKQDEGE